MSISARGGSASIGGWTTDPASSLRFDVITLFPDLFGPHLTQGVTRRAFESGQVEVRLWPLRDFADDNYRRVDDRPYGGGPGMVMLVEPLERVLGAIRSLRPDGSAPLVHYSRPERLPIAGGVDPVPPVLLSGNHADIARWRRERSLELTARRRPDLIAAARAAGALSAPDEAFLASLGL